MTEPAHTTILASVALALGTFAAGVVSYLYKRQVNRIDDHDERIADLERTALTKVDLQDAETRLATAIVSGNTETQRLLSAAHRRIDELYRDIPGR